MIVWLKISFPAVRSGTRFAKIVFFVLHLPGSKLLLKVFCFCNGNQLGQGILANPGQIQLALRIFAMVRRRGQDDECGGIHYSESAPRKNMTVTLSSIAVLMGFIVVAASVCLIGYVNCLSMLRNS